MMHCIFHDDVRYYLVLVGMALHGGTTLADDNATEVKDFDFDDQEEAFAAGYFDKGQQGHDVGDVPTNTSRQNLLSMLNALS